MAQRPALLRCTARQTLMGLSSTAPSCWWATLAGILAAPILLWRTPPCHPVCEACIAVVRSAGGDRSATGALPRAAFPMHPAAPLLLAHGPAHDPVCEAVCTIVWVGWRGRRNGHRLRHWHWHWDRLGASDVMVLAAPILLVHLPHCRRVNCAIERIDWTDRPRRRRRTRWRLRRWRSGWRSWRWCRGWCWIRRWGRGGATDSSGLAAILLLLWRPHCCRSRVGHAN